MDIVNLPTEEAIVPAEGASQPTMVSKDDGEGREKMRQFSAQGEEETTTTTMIAKKAKKHKLTFASTAEDNEKILSQTSSNYKQVLSQPASSLSHKERLLWLQERRSIGLWVQCDDCHRWRFLKDVLDSHELPAKWFCNLNLDRKMASCSVPEEKLTITDEEELIHNEYSAGSLVWARMQGWPWWPAMVDDCPDTEQFYWLDGFSDIPTYYNVVFFDQEASRAWISPENLLPYTDYSGNQKHLEKAPKKLKPRVQKAILMADKAANLSLPDRLAKFSFIARYPGHIKTPKKVNKAVLMKYQRKLQVKYNVPFPLEQSSKTNTPNRSHESEPAIQNNMILLGTPKKQKAAAPRRVLSSSNCAEMIPDPLISVTEDQEVEDINTQVEVDPNSMMVQLRALHTETNALGDNQTMLSTHCETEEIIKKKPEGPINKAQLNNRNDNYSDDESKSMQTLNSESRPTDRIPTPRSDDFDF